MNEYDDDDDGFVCVRCSAQGIANSDPSSDFCPGCGLHMEEE